MIASRSEAMLRPSPNALEFTSRCSCTTTFGWRFNSASSSMMPASRDNSARSRNSATLDERLARRGQHLRPREEIPLEQIEAEIAGYQKILTRFDLFGDQRFAVLAQRRREFPERAALRQQEIDLDDIGVRQHREECVRQFPHVVERDLETRLAQVGKAREEPRVDRHRLEDSSTKRSGDIRWTMSSNSSRRPMFT